MAGCKLWDSRPFEVACAWMLPRVESRRRPSCGSPKMAGRKSALTSSSRAGCISRHRMCIRRQHRRNGSRYRRSAMGFPGQSPLFRRIDATQANATATPNPIRFPCLDRLPRSRRATCPASGSRCTLLPSSRRCWARDEGRTSLEYQILSLDRTVPLRFFDLLKTAPLSFGCVKPENQK